MVTSVNQGHDTWITDVTKADAIEHDVTVLRDFVGLYCRRKHRPPGGGPCADCQSLLDYAVERRRRCPLDPKPACRKCVSHCYREPYKTMIREVMRFSGPHRTVRRYVDRLRRLFFR